MWYHKIARTLKGQIKQPVWHLNFSEYDWHALKIVNLGMEKIGTPCPRIATLQKEKHNFVYANTDFL